MRSRAESEPEERNTQKHEKRTRIHRCHSPHFTQGKPLSPSGTTSEQGAEGQSWKKWHGTPWPRRLAADGLEGPRPFSFGGIQPSSLGRLLWPMSQKTIFSLWQNLNYFLNKHEQIQEVLSKKLGGTRVTQGLDTIQPLHKADSAENKKAAGHEVPGKHSMQQEPKKTQTGCHEPDAAAPNLKAVINSISLAHKRNQGR